MILNRCARLRPAISLILIGDGLAREMGQTAPGKPVEFWRIKNGASEMCEPSCLSPNPVAHCYNVIARAIGPTTRLAAGTRGRSDGPERFLMLFHVACHAFAALWGLTRCLGAPVAKACNPGFWNTE